MNARQALRQMAAKVVGGGRLFPWPGHDDSATSRSAAPSARPGERPAIGLQPMRQQRSLIRAQFLDALLNIHVVPSAECPPEGGHTMSFLAYHRSAVRLAGLYFTALTTTIEFAHHVSRVSSGTCSGSTCIEMLRKCRSRLR